MPGLAGDLVLKRLERVVELGHFLVVLVHERGEPVDLGVGLLAALVDLVPQQVQLVQQLQVVRARLLAALRGRPRNLSVVVCCCLLVRRCGGGC